MSKNNLLITGLTGYDYFVNGKFNLLDRYNGGTGANVSMVCANLGMDVSFYSIFTKGFCESKYYSYLNQTLNLEDSNIVLDDKMPQSFMFDDGSSYFYLGAGKEFSEINYIDNILYKYDFIHLTPNVPNFNLLCSSVEDITCSIDFGQDLKYYNSSNIKEILNNVNILFGNEYEIKNIINKTGHSIEDLTDLVDIVVMSCGNKGSFCFSNKGKYYSNIFPSEIVDPTGCGDSFRGAFLSQYYLGEDIQYCLDFASCVASFIIENYGAQTNIPNMDRIYTRLIN